MRMSWLGSVALLGLVGALASCFEDPNEKITIGSCRTERPNEPGIIEACEEWFQARHTREAEAENCRQTGSTWSDDPCPTENSCGHCIEPRSTETRTGYWYPREDDPISETVLQESCEDLEEDMWVDNPQVSCE